jgi:RNA polymerase sigma factor (sigma-70 family)
VVEQLYRLAQPAPEAAPDTVLLARFVRSRDEAAFAALVARHGPMVLRVCRRALGDPHAAEDAFQATFLVLARRAGAIRRRASLAAWLHGVAYRVSHKARAARGRCVGGDRAAENALDPRPDPLAELSARELLRAIDEEVARLPEAYRQVVILCCLEGHSQEEAARLLGWTPGSVKGRLERGRARLHARLKRRGLTLTAALAAANVARGAGTMPVALATTTSRAAALFASGSAAAAGMVPANVASLAGGVLKMMGLKQFALTAALTLAVGAVASAGLLAYGALAGGQTPAAEPGARRPAGPQAATPSANKPERQVLLGTVARVAEGPGDQKILVLEDGTRVPVDSQTEYFLTTGRPSDRASRPAARGDTPGKPVLIRTQQRGRRAVAEVVILLAPQPPQAPRPEMPPAPGEAPLAWGKPHNGLRAGVAFEGAGGGGGRFALAVENVGKDDLLLNLGAMLANGKKQFPQALRLTLTDGKGATHGLRRTFGFVAGRLDPLVVPLPAGGRYTLRYDLADLIGDNPGVALAPGGYQASVEYVGKAVTRQDTANETWPILMPYWTGTVRSGEVRFTLPAGPGGEGPGPDLPGKAKEPHYRNPPPNDVIGKVLKVAPKDGLVQISIGQDAGLSTNLTLEVYRLKPQPLYLGRLLILEVTSNSALGRALRTPGSKVPQFQVDDRVTSRIK